MRSPGSRDRMMITARANPAADGPTTPDRFPFGIAGMPAERHDQSLLSAIFLGPAFAETGSRTLSTPASYDAGVLSVR
ncbi:MAG: hypothetical protein ACK48N_14585, partial [Planctomyces sp.]